LAFPVIKEVPVTKIGLTLDEYFELRLKPLAGADRVFEEAAERRIEELFPMSTVSASHHLRSRGYDSRPELLETLVEDGVVTLGEGDTWTQGDVEAAVEHFEDCQLFVPYAMMCYALGCSYGDFCRALREAAELESAKYGRPIRDDDQLFVMHRVPPRGIPAQDGGLAGIVPAKLSFTLCDDIREMVERGEEV